MKSLNYKRHAIILASIKQAEMELQEAAFKLLEGEAIVSKSCLGQANGLIDMALAQFRKKPYGKTR